MISFPCLRRLDGVSIFCICCMPIGVCATVDERVVGSEVETSTVYLPPNDMQLIGLVEGG